ncbi:hypothetical protein GCM10027280_17860 [Micromonospora polyrhachis]|uniref:Kef-type K+ transport system membrane component KefB n=1 Tax=Micromonospora polyrhachis TaxID=1282883 RepID=A0A7W7WN58_9ACTN|nr:cation:proton antiporter [Micromonospora polyrhachis]MBB4956883.1 Kef-type K+ transport system membrane component KefB [Micromonospora polyrhachis]
MPLPPAALTAEELLVLLLQLGLLLLLALLLGRLAVRLGLPAVAGELCVGVFLGPTLLGQIAPDLSGWLMPQDAHQFHLLDSIGQLGVLLLVGITGIEVDLGLVRRRRGTALSVGLGGLVIPLLLGVGVGFLVPGWLIPDGTSPVVFALFLGVAMCVSAIPVIARTLMDLNLLHRNVGQLTLAAATIDDVFGWFMLSIVSAMAASGVRAGNVLLALFYLGMLVVLAWWVGRPVVRAVLRRASRFTESGPTITSVTVIVLLSAAGAHALGLEAVFGAFVGGILVGSSGAVDLARLAPLRTVVMAVLAPLFFATAGLRLDLTTLWDPVILLMAVVALVIAVVGKFAGVFIGARLGGLDRWESLAVGAGLNARGVIQIVVATVGLRLGVLNTATYTIIILVAIVTSLMAAPVLKATMRRVEHTEEEELRRRERAAFTDAGVPQPGSSSAT